jgi:hypothetical protein
MKKVFFSQKSVTLVVVACIVFLSLGIVFAIYLVPPTQKTVEHILPNSLFSKETSTEIKEE